MNDIISTFNDLYYKIQISHNICLADVRNICLKSYNNSVVCDVDGGAPEIYYEILERDCGHFAVLKIERNSHEIIYESVNADFAAIALFLFLSRHQIKKTDNDIEIKFLLLLCLQIKLTFFIMAIQFYFVQNLINQILNVDI